MDHQAGGFSLGHRIGTFHGLRISFHTWIFLYLPWCLLTLFILTYGTLLARNAYQRYGPTSALTHARNWYLIAIISLVLLSGYLLYQLSITWRKIEVYEGGLIFYPFAFLSRPYRWSEISGTTVFVKTYTFMEKELKTIPGGIIFTHVGNPIPLTNKIQNIPRLVELVKSKIYPLLRPKFQSDFRSGKMVHFGQISICNKYLKIKKRQIPWDYIVRLSIQSGYLVIELKDQTIFKNPISTIPNLELLLQLIEWGSNP